MNNYTYEDINVCTPLAWELLEFNYHGGLEEEAEYVILNLTPYYQHLIYRLVDIGYPDKDTLVRSILESFLIMCLEDPHTVPYDIFEQIMESVEYNIHPNEHLNNVIDWVVRDIVWVQDLYTEIHNDMSEVLRVKDKALPYKWNTRNVIKVNDIVTMTLFCHTEIATVMIEGE